MACATALGVQAYGGELVVGHRAPSEVELPPPTFEVNTTPSIRGQAKPAAGLTLYSIGEPSEIEQEYLELLNRARLDPVGEGIRLRDTTDPDVRNAYYQENGDGTVRWSVDTNHFATVMSGISPVPPLAFNPKLIIAARGHSRWMFENAVQVHDQPGLKPSQRVQNAGYDWAAVAENIFSYARTVYHGHAGFEVDWGEGPLGMQEPPGHRLNNHSAIFTEVGIGVVEGMNSVQINGQLSTVGPQVVTVDFGMPQTVVPLVTGVAYFDLNTNGRYDAGEGVGGVQVEVSGSSYYAITSSSGGYAVPSPAPATQATFSGQGFQAVAKSLTPSGGKNVKADLVLVYTPPSILGGTSPGLNVDNPYAVTPVPGATGYRVRTVRLTPTTFEEGAEKGTGNVQLTTDPGYQFITTEVPPLEGTRVFHLVHNGTGGASPNDQWIQFKPKFRAKTTSMLKFGSMLGYATDQQVARAQVSTNGGATWQDVWTQLGSGGKGETVFTRRSISLASLTGKEFQVRLGYTLGFGSYFYQIDKGVGLYLDEIQLSGAEIVEELSTIEVPTELGAFAMSAQPKFPSKTLATGPFLSVTSVPAVVPVALRMAAPILGPGGKLRLDFEVTSGVPSGFVLEQLSALGGGWSMVAGASLATNSPTSYSYRVTPGSGQAFYRVKVP